MKHAILGVGAIGGLMGTALGYVGEDVTLLVRPEKVRDYPKELSLRQPDRVITAAAHAASRISDPVDVLWIATKTYQMHSALDSLDVAAGNVIPLLNGFEHMQVLRSRFGTERVHAGAIAVEAERLSEGSFVQHSIVRLTVAASAEPLLGNLFQQLETRLGFLCRFVDNEQTLLWTKLCFLASLALVTSASGKNKGEVFADPKWRGELEAVIAEAAAVANASGAMVDPEKTRAVFDPLPDSMRASMAKDLAAGRKLELDAIGGAILRAAAQHGIAVPTIAELVASIERQAGERRA